MNGLILTGGRSTRMGRDKGTATLHGRPLLDYVLGCFAGFCDEVYISVGANGERYERWETEGIAKLIIDEVADQGPVGGLAAASKRLREGYVAVSSGDSPFVKQDFYLMLAQRAEGRAGAVPLIAGRHEPLHAVYSGLALGEFARCLAEGKLRPTQAYERLGLAFVSEEECRGADAELMTLVNINTPEELEMWERRLGAPAP